MTLVPTDESKDTLKSIKKLWNKIRYFIRSITNNLDSYDKKYMKIKFNSDDDLPRYMIIVFRSVFHKGNKYYPEVFLNECLYKL